METIEVKDPAVIKLLMSAIGVPRPWFCTYCNTRVNVKNWGGLMPTQKDNPIPYIVLCKNIICMSTYIMEMEEDTDSKHYTKTKEDYNGN